MGNDKGQEVVTVQYGPGEEQEDDKEKPHVAALGAKKSARARAHGGHALAPQLQRCFLLLPYHLSH